MDKLRDILAVCLSTSREKSMVYAMYNGEKLLVVTEVILSGGYADWGVRVIDEVKKRVGEGWLVLVEEGLTNLVSRHATPFRGSDLFGSATYIHAAITAYHDLSHKGLIDYAVKAKGLRLSDNLIETVPDEKGRPRYDINTDGIKPGNIGVLMCAFASLYATWGDGRYLDEMYKQLLHESESENRLSRYHTIMNKISTLDRIS